MVVIYFFFLYNENAWNALQSNPNFLKFPRGSMLTDPLDVCIFTAQNIHPHTHEKSWLYAPMFATSGSPSEKETKRITSSTNQDGKYNKEQAVQTVKTWNAITIRYS